MVLDVVFVQTLPLPWVLVIRSCQKEHAPVISSQLSLLLKYQEKNSFVKFTFAGF